MCLRPGSTSFRAVLSRPSPSTNHFPRTPLLSDAPSASLMWFKCSATFRVATEAHLTLARLAGANRSDDQTWLMAEEVGLQDVVEDATREEAKIHGAGGGHRENNTDG